MYTGKYLSLERSGIIGKSRDYNDYCCLCGICFRLSRSTDGPRQANLVLIAYASSEGSGEPAHPRSLARTSAARSYKQWIKRNLQTESQIPSPPAPWMAGHAQLKFVMTECSKTQIRLTRLRCWWMQKSFVNVSKIELSMHGQQSL